MSKSLEAFRTIGEVAEELVVPKHVLRFWEGKFPHIRPMKRGGGRRYYRPEDMELLRGIRYLLHAEGYTIKGVQKILREQGIDQVKAAAAAASASAISAGRNSKSRSRNQRGSRDATPPVAAQAKVAAPASASAILDAHIVSDAVSKEISSAAAKRLETSPKDVIAAAIRELEICRQMLAASGGKTSHRDAPRLRSARS